LFADQGKQTSIFCLQKTNSCHFPLVPLSIYILIETSAYMIYINIDTHISISTCIYCIYVNYVSISVYIYI
jgi:hypothetical protein